ncbi:TonB-dependent siderophore receptor [Brevundimonas basaltis]|uniref:Catecholate siderophore receptor n=1 Tax=Brevundimonas basaltis TaxID=472166 RepID=A0A7W8MHQ7_9CAUL|nr:TonB-dependent siderophore receptor [Brevundimonas basaltis]MBB5292904.1 catecholate siderophore receptor [Brevundimonas basaltis]
MRVLLTSTAILLAVPAFATAQEAEELAPILVTGRSHGYVATNSVTATKTDTALLNVPQTVNVVTREQLDDQALRSLGELLRYVPGTTVGQGEGNRDQITLRGQNTTADFFLDGVRDDTQYFRGLYNLERVEVLKGPYALIFGRGGGGGIVNRVQKTPSLTGAMASGRISANSFGAWDVSVDANTPVSEAAAVRINAVYENLDNHRDIFEGERYAVNPYVAVDLNADWRAGLSYEYVNDDRVVDRGVPSLDGAPLTGFRDQFFGVPGANRTTLEAHIAKLRIDGDLADDVSVSTTILYGDYAKVYTNAFASGPATSQTGTVPLAAYTDPTDRQNLLIQSNLTWDVTTGGLGHKVLFGLEYGDQDSANQRRNGVLSSSTLDLANPVFPTVTFPALSRNTTSNVESLSAYVQDQIAIGDQFQVVAGLRYDRFEITGVDLQPDPDRPFARADEKVSPRLGLIYKPRPAVSIYGSYSQSFLPRSGDQFLKLSPTDQNLEPEEFTNHEIGVKWDVRPNLNLTAAVFRLDRTNATTPDPQNPTATINVGETRTEGFELAVTGVVRPNWQVSGGYAWLDARLQGNESVRLAQTPEHQFSLWNRYDVNPRLGIGLGVIHQAGQYAAIRTSAATTRLPAFTRVDAAAYYRVSEGVELQLNIENLFDTTYFPDAHNNNNISTGAPLNARLTLSSRF